jgi:hypothetical protein
MRYAMAFLFVFLLACSVVRTQDAKVKALTAADTAEVQKKYESMIQAQKEFETVKRNMEQKYTKDESGWSYGAVFSPDFKFMVPKNTPQSACSGNGFSNSCLQIYTSPVTAN